MELTVKEVDLLTGMFESSIEHSVKSGIPIGKEYYDVIDSLKDKLALEHSVAYKREHYNRME